MRQRLIPVLVCVILVGTATTLALAQVGSPSPARAAAVRATGAFEISNSVDGAPIFAATGIAPGGSVQGKVTIEDPGSVPVALKLRRGQLTDVPGIGGAVLSGRLQVTVTDITRSGSPRTLYAGQLDSMPEKNAGELQPGAERTYEFVATLPNGAPSAQNALQSASTTVAYSWVAEKASGDGNSENRGAPAVEGGGTGAGGVTGVGVALGLSVPKILPTVGGRGLVAYVDCNAPCRISVHGRLRAGAHGHHRTAKIRFNLRQPYTPGAKKMRIPIPRGLRRWLRQMPAPKRLTAKLRFIAIGTAGGRDVVTKKVRLRVRHHR